MREQREDEDEEEKEKERESCRSSCCSTTNLTHVSQGPIIIHEVGEVLADLGKRRNFHLLEFNEFFSALNYTERRCRAIGIEPQKRQDYHRSKLLLSPLIQQSGVSGPDLRSFRHARLSDQ